MIKLLLHSWLFSSHSLAGVSQQQSGLSQMLQFLKKRYRVLNMKYKTLKFLRRRKIARRKFQRLDEEFFYDKITEPTIQMKEPTSMIVPDKKVSLAANNIQTPPLNTPMPDKKLVASMPQVNQQTGLTRTESALLSPSEQVIARRT